MKVTTVRIPESLYEDLTDEAEERDLSVSEYIRDVLRAREHTEGHTLGDTDLAERVAELEAADDERGRRLGELEERLGRVEEDIGEIRTLLSTVEKTLQKEDDSGGAYDPTEEF